MEHKRLGLIIREADTNFRKVISAVAAQLSELIKDNKNANKLTKVEDSFKKITDTPKTFSSISFSLLIEFIPRKTNISKREANEEVKDRGFNSLNSRLNNLRVRETYSILNPLIIDGKNVIVYKIIGICRKS